MWDGYPTVHAQMGPMARTVRDLAKLLDGMVGYDPEDPVTALGVGKVEGGYTKYLDQGALRTARELEFCASRSEISRTRTRRIQDRRCRLRKKCRRIES